ncbi:MAG TPA: guanylate kinase, partial [Candidatus Brocadiales bacterium]|nr:guanylate kinase [Candidatus Brocadiales bacterium]
MKGKLVIISAPSGCGKTTVCGRLTQMPNIKKSISVTTRAPRAYEKDGVHYHFISRDEFYKRIDEGKFAEYAEYCGNLYGTPLDLLTKALEDGLICLLEIDVHGAMQICKKFPD